MMCPNCKINPFLKEETEISKSDREGNLLLLSGECRLCGKVWMCGDCGEIEKVSHRKGCPRKGRRWFKK